MRFGALYNALQHACSIGGAQRDVTRGTKVLLQSRKQRRSERTSGQRCTLSKVAFNRVCEFAGLDGMDY